MTECDKCRELEKRVAELEARLGRMGPCPARLPTMPTGVTCMLPIGHDGCHEQTRDGEAIGWGR